MIQKKKIKKPFLRQSDEKKSENQILEEESSTLSFGENFSNFSEEPDTTISEIQKNLTIDTWSNSKINILDKKNTSDTKNSECLNMTYSNNCSVDFYYSIASKKKSNREQKNYYSEDEVIAEKK